MVRKMGWLAKVRTDGQGENLKVETTPWLMFTEFSLANRTARSTFHSSQALALFSRW